MEAAPTHPGLTRLARVLLAVIAIVLIAWFGLVFRNYRLGSEAAERVIFHPGMSDAAWADSMDDLRRAETLDPSTEWSVTRANYLLLRDKPAALAVARSVVRKEPDNLAGWVVAAKAATGRDPAFQRRANAAIQRLNPPPSRPR
jgi:hypothetical protein